jgi:hypothetical protein
LISLKKYLDNLAGEGHPFCLGPTLEKELGSLRTKGDQTEKEVPASIFYPEGQMTRRHLRMNKN